MAETVTAICWEGPRGAGSVRQDAPQVPSPQASRGTVGRSSQPWRQIDLDSEQARGSRNFFSPRRGL